MLLNFEIKKKIAFLEHFYQEISNVKSFKNVLKRILKCFQNIAKQLFLKLYNNVKKPQTT